MNRIRLFAFLCLASLPSVAACAATPADEDVEEIENALVQFAASHFAGAPALGYGDTSAAIETSRTKWGVIRWNGATGDDVVATVAATTPDRKPRAYLVERRADGKYVAVLAGTQSTDGLVKAKLDKTQEYFIVFRDASRRNASFTAKLERAGGLPAGCSGSPLLEPQIIERTPQAQNPAISTTGTYKTSIRRCNVATGCADPVEVTNPNTSIAMIKSNGKWVIQTPFSVTHDGATGELTGTANVRADDGRNIAVVITGAATTGCISASGRSRSEIDAITYYDVDVSFQAATPPVAPRTVYPLTPPPTPCEAQEPIPDEEVLARFPRGAASVLLGQATIIEDQQYCHPQTGCRAWTFGPANPGNSGQRIVQATAHVLGRDSLGISFYNNYSGAHSAKFTLDDGAITVTADQLLRANGVRNTASISETHISLKETDVSVQGEWKYRRYVCIPIPPHP